MRTPSAASQAVPAVAPSISMANSSPPWRAVMAAPGAVSRRTAAKPAITASPVAWPKVSLTRLKWSRSKRATAIGRPVRRARASAASARRSNPRRLARPDRGSVSEASWDSVIAFWATISSSRRPAATSRMPELDWEIMA